MSGNGVKHSVVGGFQRGNSKVKNTNLLSGPLISFPIVLRDLLIWDHFPFVLLFTFVGCESVQHQRSLGTALCALFSSGTGSSGV